MTTFLNTPVLLSDARLKVDRELGIIRDVAVIKKGTAKGHNFNIDSDFLDSVVTLANEHTPGVKARFGHPNMCATALGTYLGRFKNYHRQGDVVLADIYLDEVARKSPSGDLYSYVLDMAENNPDMFGASIAFKHGEFKEPDNAEQKLKTATIEYLYATDLVDMPAATNGLFSAFSHDDTASQVTLFLDEHPEVFELADKHPELIDDFLIKYKLYKESKLKNPPAMNLEKSITDLKQWITDNFQSKTPEGLSADHQAIFDQLQTDFENQISEFVSMHSEIETLLAQLETSNQELETLKIELKTSNLKLETLQSELNQLKAKPSNPDKPADPAINLNKSTSNGEFVNLKDQMPEDAKLKFTTYNKSK